MKKEIVSLQILRGFAAISIVFIHMNAIIRQYGAEHRYLFPSTEMANAGVDVFFVISGVIMALITSRIGDQPGQAGPFLLKRITRIYPIYWIYLFLFIIGNLLIQGSIMETSGNFSLLSVAQSALLIPNQDLPILIIAWTLEFEIYFYLLFAVLLALGWHGNMKYLSAISVLLVGIGTFYQPELAVWSLITDPLLLEFTAGVFLGRLYLSRKRPNPIPLFIFAVILIALENVGWSAAEIFDMYGTRFGRLVRFGIPAIFITAAFLFANERIIRDRVKILERIGDASYSLYLSHLLVLSIAGKVWSLLGLQQLLPDLLFAVYLLGACVVWSILSYDYLEVPIIQRIRRSLPH